MIEGVAISVVASAGLYFGAIAFLALLVPARANRFLLAFASSPGKHYAELAFRFFFGGAFVIAAPQLPFALAFKLFGWMLLGTTLVLAFFPWRWHQRFAELAVPKALRFLPFIGVSSAVFGALIFWAVWRGNGA